MTWTCPPFPNGVAVAIPRLTSSPELSNALLAGVALALTLALVWGAVASTGWLLSHVALAVRPDAVQSWVIRLRRQGVLAATVFSVGLTAVALAVLGYGVWRKIDLHAGLEAELESFGSDSLRAVARAVGGLLALALGALVLSRVARNASERLGTWLRARGDLALGQPSLDGLLKRLPGAVHLGLIQVMVALARPALRLPAWLDWLLATTVYVLLLLSACRALAAVAAAVCERLNRAWEVRSQGSSLGAYYAGLRRLLPVGQRSLEAILYVSAATLAVHEFQTLEPFAPYGPLAIRLITIFFAGSVGVELGRGFVARALVPDPALLAEDVLRRRSTLVSLLQGGVRYLIYGCVALMMLNTVGIDPTPILAGAGILGLAVGLGSQKIVQDLVSGLFLLMEDQILQGDYVRVGEAEGVVEAVHLRVTRVRDRMGRLHTLRNGDIQNVINYSRGWTMAVVDMSVAYECDIRRAFEVIEQCSTQLHERMPGQVLERPRIAGLEAMAESCLQVRIEAKVRPGTHWDVKRALNLLLLNAFNAHGLEIPYPKSVQFEAEPPARA